MGSPEYSVGLSTERAEWTEIEGVLKNFSNFVQLAIKMQLKVGVTELVFAQKKWLL